MSGRSSSPPGAAGAARGEALAVLGLPPDATAAQVTRRFRELAKATHPDTTAGTAGDPRAVAPDAARRMTALCDAYHLLTATPPPAEDAAGRPTAVPVRVRRDDTPPAPVPRPWIVAGPVRVHPWPTPEREDAEKRRAGS